MLPNLSDLSGSPRPPRSRAPSPWTQERLRHLRRRWKQGARAREIGAELGVTANAVIAKIHRLGIARLSPYGGAPGRRLALRRIPAGDRPHRVRRRAFSLRRAPPAPHGILSVRPRESGDPEPRSVAPGFPLSRGRTERDFGASAP